MPEAAGEVEVLSVVGDVAAIVMRITNNPAYRVVLSGSWASGTPRARSDIDIGVQGPQPIDPVTLQAIRAACDALPTLYTIDLVDLAILPPTIREAALSNAIVVGRMMGTAQRRITVFSQALARLDEALARPEDPIVRDACIQRFEFTFEMAWEAVQAQAMSEGLECVSPRDCFCTVFRLGLVENDARRMAMVEERNRTTYAYDEKAAREIYRSLPDYAGMMRRLLERLTERSQ
jgi:nucleotidyltransferase substrate binding protein (TIGR01987 family)